MPDNHIIVKLDFGNAFNSIRRDLVFDSIAVKIPELYCFVYASCSSNPILTFRSRVILSKEGFQQGNPLSSLDFCDTIHPILSSLNSDLRIGFMDDFSLSGEVSVVTEDAETLVCSAEETDLFFNASKCEIIANNVDIIKNLDTFKDFIRIALYDMMLLGAPVLIGPAVDTLLQNKVGELKRAINRLKLLHSHDALVLLRNSLAMLKLLYTLRTSPCADNRILSDFDETLKSGLTTILNVDISNDQWLQAFLPVRNGGLGIRSAEMLAPSTE